MRNQNLRRLVLVAGCMLASCMFAFGEDMKVTVSVPFGLLSRVFQLSYDGKAGTCFVVDLDERQ